MIYLLKDYLLQWKSYFNINNNKNCFTCKYNGIFYINNSLNSNFIRTYSIQLIHLLLNWYSWMSYLILQWNPNKISLLLDSRKYFLAFFFYEYNIRSNYGWAFEFCITKKTSKDFGMFLKLDFTSYLNWYNFEFGKKS